MHAKFSAAGVSGARADFYRKIGQCNLTPPWEVLGTLVPPLPRPAIVPRIEYDALEPGDIIVTRTPEGVDAVRSGDVMVGSVAGVGQITVRVAG